MRAHGWQLVRVKRNAFDVRAVLMAAGAFFYKFLRACKVYMCVCACEARHCSIV